MALLPCVITSTFYVLALASRALSTCTGQPNSQLVTVYRYSMKARDFALHGHTFQNGTAVDEADCFHQCMTECRCVSYNFQPFDERKCELNEEERRNDPTQLNIKPGSNYYEIQTNTQVPWKCRNRCCTPNPCQNGAKCQELCGTNKRFNCSCASGFIGRLCNIRSTTCIDILRANRTSISGVYLLTPTNGTAFKAFCHMNVSSGMAWTLVMSYALENSKLFNHWPLLVDKVFNENSPENTTIYRLSRSRMLLLAAQSKEWRATCNFHINGIDFRDYDVARLDMLNPLTYNNSGCQLLDYLNIRGSQCRHCSAWVKQGYLRMFQIKTGFEFVNKNFYTCDFQPTPNGNYEERNFGFYRSAWISTDFRCSADNKSTTEFWFGGSV